MKIITSVNKGDYFAWHAKAAVDDGVWPFLSMTPRYYLGDVEEDDWRQFGRDLPLGVVGTAALRDGCEFAAGRTLARRPL